VSISSLGNQIFLNQNMSVIGTKFSNAHARLTSQDVINSDNFEENYKRLKETREAEETEAIDEHLIDNAVYDAHPKYKKRERDSKEEREEPKQLLDEKHKKIDMKI
jgi:hypothetical protein